MPWFRYSASTSRSDARVPPMHDRWGAAARPSSRISSTVASVPSRVEPPAPKVTEQNAGASCSELRARRAQLRHAFGRLRREELDAVQRFGGRHGQRQTFFGISSDASAHEMRL